MTLVRNYRKSDTLQKTDPDFASLEIGERRFLKLWTLSQIRYALLKHNEFYGGEIRIRCESLSGCAKDKVTAAIVIRRIA